MSAGRLPLDRTLDTCWRFLDEEIGEEDARTTMRAIGWDEEQTDSMLANWKKYGRRDPERWRWRQMREPTPDLVAARRASEPER